MKKIVFYAILFFMSQFSYSQADNINASTPLQGMRGRPINLPDISALANIVGYISDDRKDKEKNKLSLNEVETAFQGYIYPEMRADIILAVHNHDGEYESEICEAKASFLNLGYGFSGEIGKIHIDFGKTNKLHTHHLPTTDKPLMLEKFFGEHELAGQGAVLKYLIPIFPFYSQIQAGFWDINAHSHAQEEASVLDITGSTITVNSLLHDDSSFSPSDKVYTARWNSSFDMNGQKEIEIGLSGLKGRGAHYQEHKDNVEMIGADITFKWFPDSYKKWTFQNEWMRLKRDIPVGTLNRDGFYSFLNYRADKYWDYGVRLDYSENAWPQISYERSFSAIITRHLTETSYWRITGKHRNINGKNISEGWFQLSFGIGPHSHELE
ncbi:MAG: hypothetical protein AB1637_07065 [Elusimicrobiota bacterium]